MHALFVSYLLRDANLAQHAELCEQLAPAVAAVPGLLSKTWLANTETGRFGGFYVFASRAAFERCVASELFDTLMSAGSIRDLTTSDFSVAPIPPSAPSSQSRRPTSTDTTLAVPGARTSPSHTASWDIRSALRLRWRRRGF
jgi:hypothetical protein